MFINNTATTPQEAVDTAIDILERKINTYEQFNRTFPGYGGFLPWVWSQVQTTDTYKLMSNLFYWFLVLC